MPGPPVEMMLTDKVYEIDQRSRWCETFSGRITVHLKKALYGCIQSAVLLFKELKTTLNEVIFNNDPYNMCSFTRSSRNGGREGGRNGKREGTMAGGKIRGSEGERGCRSERTRDEE